jgi:uncharacterized protein (DUF488 family)
MQQGGAMPLFTIGHGNRSAGELAAMLAEHSVVLLVDVRRFPGSRRFPHLSRGALALGLPALGVAYRWSGEALGGRRRPVPVTRHPAWRQPAFRAYADHMDTVEFRVAFTGLIQAAAEVPTAIMCAETLWWRCHRRLIADAATLAGTSVVHLLGPGSSQPHPLAPFVRAGEDGWPVYDLGGLEAAGK